MIFKMLSARKARYGWLVAELTIVALATWALADPIIIQSAIEWQDKGFDEHRLYRIELKSHPEISPHFVQEEEGQWRDDQWRLWRMVRDYPGVASATFQGETGPFCPVTTVYNVHCDTLSTSVYGIDFMPRSDFFTTFRFAENGRPSNEDIDRMTFEDGSSVLSAETFPGRSGTGLTDTLSGIKVAATTGMVRICPGVPAVAVWFLPKQDLKAQAIVFRLDNHTDEQDFLPAFTDWAKKQLKAGNLYVRNVQPYTAFIDDSYAWLEPFAQIRLVLGAFFLFCLFLGVSGTFWMQTDSRREEIGIMKSFGATSARIVRILITEGIILATIAVMAGCFIYLQYALKEGLYISDANLRELLSGRYWFEDFATHFAIVSFITWAIVVIVVCIGIYIPASRISRITPTDALRDE